MSAAGAGYRSLSPPRPPLCPATSPAYLLLEPRLQPQTRTEATDLASWRVVMSAPWDTLGDSPSDVQEGSNVPRAAAFTVTAARPTGALGQHRGDREPRAPSPATRARRCRAGVGGFSDPNFLPLAPPFLLLV